jgi:hypothetical protein
MIFTEMKHFDFPPIFFEFLRSSASPTSATGLLIPGGLATPLFGGYLFAGAEMGQLSYWGSHFGGNCPIGTVVSLRQLSYGDSYPLGQLFKWGICLEEALSLWGSC